MTKPKEPAAPRLLNIWKDDRGLPEGSVDRREKLSRKEFLHEYLRKNRPVVLTDAARDWPALSKWTPDFFRKHYGSKDVPVFQRKRSVTLKDTVRLSEYIDEITSPAIGDRARYLFSLRIPVEFPELLGDLEPRPSYWDPNWLDSKYLLPGLPTFKLRNITGLEMNVGGVGSRFPFLHFDDLWTQTFITQVHGRKEWVLYEPDQTEYLYPTDDADNISKIPMETDVNLDEFPLFARAKPHRFILKEGEMLFGAPGWWHTTRSLTPSIAVVLSTANGPTWARIKKSAFERAWRHPRWYVRPVALPIVTYMTLFGIVKSRTEPF